MLNGHRGTLADDSVVGLAQGEAPRWLVARSPTMPSTRKISCKLSCSRFKAVPVTPNDQAYTFPRVDMFAGDFPVTVAADAGTEILYFQQPTVLLVTACSRLRMFIIFANVSVACSFVACFRTMVRCGTVMSPKSTSSVKKALTHGANEL